MNIQCWYDVKPSHLQSWYDVMPVLSVMEIPHLVQVMGGGGGGGGNRSPLTMAVVVCMTDDGG